MLHQNKELLQRTNSSLRETSWRRSFFTINNRSFRVSCLFMPTYAAGLELLLLLPPGRQHISTVNCCKIVAEITSKTATNNTTKLKTKPPLKCLHFCRQGLSAMLLEKLLSVSAQKATKKATLAMLLSVLLFLPARKATIPQPGIQAAMTRRQLKNFAVLLLKCSLPNFIS